MSNDKSLATTTPSTALQAWGDREDIREITDRLMMMHPAAQDVGVNGMRAVAQLAIMSGANPLPSAGEIHTWKDWDGRIVASFGIAYYRRKAAEKDTVVWLDGDSPRTMTKQERQEYGIPDDAQAAICRGFLLSEYLALLQTGVPWQPAQKMLARTSTAVVAHKEMFQDKDTKYKHKGDPKDPPKGRTWQWVAEKRAEIGFYRMKALVDTGFTDAMAAKVEKLLGQMEYEAGERPHYTLSEPDPSTAAIRDMDLDEVNDLLYGDQNGVQREDDDAAIEGEYEPVEKTATPQQPEAPTDDSPPNNAAEFAKWFVARHAFYNEPKEVIGVLNKKFPNVGVNFTNYKQQELIDELERHAKTVADAAAE